MHLYTEKHTPHTVCVWAISEGKSSTKVRSCQFLFVVVQLNSCVWLFETPWTAACQASLFFTISRTLLKLLSIELVMPSNHLIICHPLLFLPSIFPRIRVFSNESALCIRWPKYYSFCFSIRPSNEYLELPEYLKGFPSGLTGFISLQSRELSRVFSSTTVQRRHSLGLSVFYCPALTSIRDYWKNHNFE